MSSWGANTSDESKPKHLTDVEKNEVYANTKGWVKPAGGNDNPAADEEVLVAIGGLNTALGSANISVMEFITTTADVSAGYDLSVRVKFNEAVDIVGSPFVAVQNDNVGTGSGRGPYNLQYASGTGSHEIVFTSVVAAGSAATAANDGLTIGANAMNLNGGTVKDAGTVTNSTITNSVTIGAGAGTLTVVA
jgi:hypothetical protein